MPFSYTIFFFNLLQCVWGGGGGGESPCSPLLGIKEILNGGVGDLYMPLHITLTNGFLCASKCRFHTRIFKYIPGGNPPHTPFPCSVALLPRFASPLPRPLKNPGYTSERGAKLSLEFAFKNVPTIRREAPPPPAYATNNFRINNPYFSIGIMQRTLFNFRINEPYFIFGLTNLISFSD